MNTDCAGITQLHGKCSSLTCLLASCDVSVLRFFRSCTDRSASLVPAVVTGMKSGPSSWKDSETKFSVAAFYVMSLSFKYSGSLTSLKPLQTNTVFTVP